MLLSVIIVNYNVKYFLEQCLHSVERAAQKLPTEVIVVDNHSTDGSLAYLAPRFPWVRFLTNDSNTGFGRACNRGLAESTGTYILFLNPDTLVGENSFVHCIRFFEAQSACGAVGVKMIDGSGRFLKESKRAFPSPLTSFFKLAGLAALFPASKVFGRYHLGHLSKEKPHEVDVLAGAFLLTKKDVLQKVGAFDEAFFMYGEDIDLSYRIQQAGYRNWYFPGVTVIHFKGESTRRGSLNYVRMFYQAMQVFVKKHYGGARASVFRLALGLAIWLRAALSAFLKLLRWVGLPVVDAALLLGSFWLCKEVWQRYVRPDVVYPDKLLAVSLPLFALLYLAVAYYAGLYDREHKRGSVLRATMVATVTLLAVYSLLPEHLRFSRGIVLLGALTALLFLSVLRWLLVKAGALALPADASAKPHLLIASSEEEYPAIAAFLHEKGMASWVIGRVGKNGGAVAPLEGLGFATKALNAKLLLFCAGALSYEEIITYTAQEKTGLQYRYHAAGSASIVGSDTSTQSGEAVAAEATLALSLPANKRLKRLLDVGLALFGLLTFPLQFLLVKRPLRFFANCLAVLGARKTWVGYVNNNAPLPALRQPVLSPNGGPPLHTANEATLAYWYARNYEPAQDLRTILRHYQQLGG